MATPASSATAPRVVETASHPAFTVQRECTLCGRVVTNCAAHTSFFIGEGITLGGLGYAFYLSSIPLGFFSGAAFVVMIGVQGCWLRYRNIRALGDAASTVGTAAGATQTAASDLEQAAIQGEAMAGRVSTAAGRVLTAAEALAAATGKDCTTVIASGAEEMKASAGALATQSGRLQVQLDVFKTLLVPSSALMSSVSTALTEINRSIRASSPHCSELAALQTKFAAVSTSLTSSVTAGVAESKEIYEVLAKTAILAMQIMSENNEVLKRDLEEKNVALSTAVAQAETASFHVAASSRERADLVARLEALQRANEALQENINTTVARLEAERRDWSTANSRVTAEVAVATTALSEERACLDATLVTLREYVGQLAAMGSASRPRSASGGGVGTTEA